MKKTTYFLFLAMIHHFVNAQNPLAIPDTLNGMSFSLDLQTGTTSFYPNTTTLTMGVNGNLLGPTFNLAKGRPDQHRCSQFSIRGYDYTLARHACFR